MKKLFRNYNFEFDKNERKLLTTFTRQSLKQMESDKRLLPASRAFKSILEKLESPDDTIKLTKEELTMLSFQLKENAKFLKQKSEKGWFFKKWMYKTMHLQYQSLVDTHFSD